MREILITGGTGFFGSHLAAQMLAQDTIQKIHILTRKIPVTFPTTLSREILLHQVDLTDRDATQRIINSIHPRWIFHLAAHTSRSRDEQLYSVFEAANVVATKNILYAARGVAPEAFVAAGSFEEYGPIQEPFNERAVIYPTSPYGRTKAAATELIIEESKRGLPAVVLRFPVLYGSGAPHDMFIAKAVRAGRGGPPVPLASGKVERDFLHVDDAISGLILAAKYIDRCRGEIINICSGSSVTLVSVIERIERLTGNRHLSTRHALPEREGEQYTYGGSPPTKAYTLLGWKPQISLENGLSQLLTSSEFN